MNEYMAKLAEKARESNPPAAGDFIGEDGLRRCGVCGEPKETLVEGAKLPCACRCKRDERDRVKAEKEKAQYEERRHKCFTSPLLETYRIENADDSKSSQYIQYIKEYISKWQEVKEENVGLLLWGGVGTGKSFLAACIANAVIDAGDSARMLTFGEAILNVQSATDGVGYLKDLCSKSLLILDDLGAEWDTKFGAGIVYQLIDMRSLTGKPLIVTTNIPFPEMEQINDAGKSRLYDRILERCAPVKIDGDSRRKTGAAETLQKAKSIFGIIE